MTLLRNRSALTAAVALAGALLVPGCSSGSGQEPAASPTVTTPSGVRSGRPALTAERLMALALPESEVPNSHSAPVQRLSSGRQTFPPVSDASCERLLDVMTGETASAVVGQTFNWVDDIWGGDSLLASYPEATAREEFRAARDSLKTCKSFTGVAWAGEYAAEVTVEKAPALGDEALSFHLISQLPDGGGQRDAHHVLVRTGTTVVDFHKLNVDARAQFPLALIGKQVDRLSAAQSG